MVDELIAAADNQTQYTYTTLPHREINWCSVPLSEVIASGKRLEASIFNPKARHARDTILSCKWESAPLCGKDGLASSYMGGRFKRILVKKSEFPFYLPSSVTDVYPKPDAHLSKNTKYNLDSLCVQSGQILLSRSGTIGKTTLVSRMIDNKIVSDDLIRINANSSTDIGYIYAFLRSKIGSALIQTNNYGAVIQHIEPEHLANVPIPNPPESIKAKINDLIIRSYEMRDKSNDLLDEAADMLFTELNLPSFDDFQTERLKSASGINAYSVKLSELSGRLDGSYHLPIVRAITNHLIANAGEVTNVGDKRVSSAVILPGRFKRTYVEEGYGRIFIGGKQLNELDPYGKKYLSYTHHADRIKKQLELSENMTLITCSGTIGKVMLVPRHWNHWTASQHIIRVVPASADIAGYIAVFLASDYGKQLITRFTYGSVVDEIDNHHVSQIPFPLLRNAETQAVINQLALEANDLRFQAYEAEQKAMHVLDDEVFHAN